MRSLLSTIQRGTVIDARYKKHAAHQSMAHYLDDWETAHALLGRRIEQLRALRDERKVATEQGSWP